MEVLASLQIPWIIEGKSGDSLDNSVHKFDNLDEIDQFLERLQLPKFTKEEIDPLNKPTSIKEMESLINNLPKKKTSGPDGFLVNFTKHLRNKLCQFSTISFRR